MANSQRTDSVALIEEQVDSGLRDMLASYQPGYMLGGPNRDDINKRFVIRMNAPLPHLDTGTAKAFEATDNNNPSRPIYALVLDRSFNYRGGAMDALAGSQHPHLVTLLAHATVFLTSVNEAHKVVICDKPSGKRLSEVIIQQRINQEHIIKDSILAPMSKAMAALRDKKITHGGINTHNVYIGDVLQLSECVSEPSGMSQHYLYEPVERMLTDPISKGDGNEKIDVYAAGVLTYELIYGLDHLKRMSKEEFISKALEHGIYNTFANNRDFPDSLQDFFRGILSDSPAERWGIEQLQQWINGKRFNMISSSGTHEAVRSIMFNGVEYFSQRALANSMHRHWREAMKDARQMKLDRWAEMSLHRADVAERIARVLRAAGSEAQASERQNNEMLTRLICTLDPNGPIRTQLLSLRPEGFGYALSNTLRNGLTSELQEVLDLIENDVSNYWGDLTESGKNVDFSQLMWKMQRVRLYLKVRSLGFGVERVLYDLNPNLPCQSAWLLPYHITNLPDLLRTLDTLSKKMAPDSALLDRHIAAFVASKLDMGKEVRLTDVSAIPQLAQNQELVMIKILAKAQQKQDKMPLPGLGIWAAMRIERVLDCIHNRAYRKKMKLQLKAAINNGQLNDLMNIVVNREVAVRDYEGFAHAIAVHQVNGQRIERLKNPKVVEKMARDLGGRIAAIMSYTILAVTVYIVLSNSMY